MEFSKKLLFFNWSLTIALTALFVLFSVIGLPTTAFDYVAPLAWAETAAANCYYFWKAKNENRAKYAQMFLREYTKDWDIEVALRMAEIVLKD